MSEQDHMVPPRPRARDDTRNAAPSSHGPPSPSTHSRSMPSPAYSFGAGAGGDYYRPGDHARDSNRHSDFSFRPSNDEAPRYPSHDQFLPPSPSSNQRSSQQDYGSQPGPISRAERDRYPRNPNRRGRGRGGYNFTPTHERPLLRNRRETTPEQMPGMTDAQKGQVKFMAADEVSDSNEEDMELESEAEDENLNGSAAQKPIEHGVNGGESREIDEPPRKKQMRTDVDGRPAAESTVPKWSNPDPYTVLPPPDESLKKKKDVLKLIRKARVAVEKSEPVTNAVAANEDFISFGFDDEVGDNNEGENEGEATGQGVPGAPTGPGSSHFSHLQNLHGQALKSVSETEVLPKPAPAVRPLKYQANSNDTTTDVWPPPNQDAALGNRKRTHDDEIKGDAPGRFNAKKPKKRTHAAVLPEWRPIGHQTATPWYTVDHSNSDSMSYWLHKEIVDFYDYVRPREFEELVRNDLLQRLRSFVRIVFPGSDLRCFGSFAAGIYLPNADMDLVVVSEAYMQSGRKFLGQRKKDLYTFGGKLERAEVCVPGSIEVVAAAKVPLVKFVDKSTGLKVDVSFENDTGLTANHTFQSWKAEFPAMPVIVTLVKQLLMMRGLHEVASGGLGGFSITCLVTSLLQNMPPVRNGALKPEEHLGDIFMEFLNFYGNLFNTTVTGIQLNPPGYFEKRLSNLPYRADNMHRLSILDPNNSVNDISGGTSNIILVLETFSKAFSALRTRMMELSATRFNESPSDGSILGPIFSGNYTPFTRQRERLRRLYEERAGNNQQLIAERKQDELPVFSHGTKLVKAGSSSDDKNRPDGAIERIKTAHNTGPKSQRTWTSDKTPNMAIPARASSTGTSLHDPIELD